MLIKYNKDYEDIPSFQNIKDDNLSSNMKIKRI